MAPLAPLVDQMRDIARAELPDGQTCRVQLFDDGTFTIDITHSMGPDESQRISYVRTTGEIIWEYSRGGGWTKTEFPDGEMLHEPVVEETDVRVVTTVEPPYNVTMPE